MQARSRRWRLHLQGQGHHAKASAVPCVLRTLASAASPEAKPECSSRHGNTASSRFTPETWSAAFVGLSRRSVGAPRTTPKRPRTGDGDDLYGDQNVWRSMAAWLIYSCFSKYHISRLTSALASRFPPSLRLSLSHSLPPSHSRSISAITTITPPASATPCRPEPMPAHYTTPPALAPSGCATAAAAAATLAVSVTRVLEVVTSFCCVCSKW